MSARHEGRWINITYNLEFRTLISYTSAGELCE
jgi:hypothetical protein